MAEIRHLENRHDVIVVCRGWSDLDKISETGAEWHVDCGDVVEIETRCRIPWHVIPEPSITLQGAATWWIHCHDSRATCHIAGCKNSIRHIENRFSPYLFILWSLGFDGNCCNFARITHPHGHPIDNRIFYCLSGDHGVTNTGKIATVTDCEEDCWVSSQYDNISDSDRSAKQWQFCTQFCCVS